MTVTELILEGLGRGGSFLSTPLFLVLHTMVLYAGLRWRWWMSPVLMAIAAAAVQLKIKSEYSNPVLADYLRYEYPHLIALVLLHVAVAAAVVGVARLYIWSQSGESESRE